MKFRKTLTVIAASMCVFSLNSHAKTPINLNVNGTNIDMNSKIYIKNDYTMVPARKIGEILGSEKISWNDKTKKATIEFDDNTLTVEIGSKIAHLNEKETTMPVEAEIVDNKTYLSARFICENMGAKISWNNKTKTVYIEKEGAITDNNEGSYTTDDLEWLAKIVHAEAQGETHKGKVAVANVVLNRKESREFPNNIYDVIFDKKYGVQFTPTINGAIYNNPSNESYKAAKQALHGDNVVGRSLYFLNPKKASSLWIVNNRKFYKSIGNHDFYL